MTVLDLALVAVAAAAGIAALRAIFGPSTADRAIGSDVAAVAVVAAIAILGIRSGSTVYLDAVLVGTLLVFVSTVALSLLIRRRR